MPCGSWHANLQDARIRQPWRQNKCSPSRWYVRGWGTQPECRNGTFDQIYFPPQAHLFSNEKKTAFCTQETPTIFHCAISLACDGSPRQKLNILRKRRANTQETPENSAVRPRSPAAARPPKRKGFENSSLQFNNPLRPWPQP